MDWAPTDILDIIISYVNLTRYFRTFERKCSINLIFLFSRVAPTGRSRRVIVNMVDPDGSEMEIIVWTPKSLTSNGRLQSLRKSEGFSGFC